MSEQEEEIAALKERIEAMEELIIDWNLLMHTRFPYTWNHAEGFLIQERIKELGIMGEQWKVEKGG